VVIDGAGRSSIEAVFDELDWLSNSDPQKSANRIAAMFLPSSHDHGSPCGFGNISWVLTPILDILHESSTH
jgi:hypothetical protein